MFMYYLTKCTDSQIMKVLRHARETFNYHFSPAGGYWNGTTWKAFMKWRFNAVIHSCSIDSDSGVGILSKNQLIGNSIVSNNLFFELANNRK